MSTKKAATSKDKKNAGVLSVAQALDPKTIATEVGELQVSLQTTLANVGATITNQLEKMRQVDEAIALKQVQLTELFDLEKEAQSLEEVRLRRATEESDWNQSRLDARKVWADEEKVRNQRIQRENEEYDYKTKTERQRQLAEFNDVVERLKRDEILRSESLKRDWTARELELTAKETAVKELQARVDGFDALLKSEVAKAEAIVGSRMKRDADMELKLALKDTEAERKLHASEMANSSATIASLQKQLAEVREQLEAARKDAKEVTNAALASASGRDVTNALQKAMDQQTAKTK